MLSFVREWSHDGKTNAVLLLREKNDTLFVQLSSEEDIPKFQLTTKKSFIKVSNPWVFGYTKQRGSRKIEGSFRMGMDTDPE
jgi:hypothetical protein